MQVVPNAAPRPGLSDVGSKHIAVFSGDTALNCPTLSRPVWVDAGRLRG